MRAVGLASVLLALIAIGLADQVRADEDGKTYPGIMCRAGQTVGSDRPALVPAETDGDLNGGITNSSGNAVLVLCPIVRDALSAPSSIEEARVVVNADPTDPGATCSLVVSEPEAVTPFQPSNVESLGNYAVLWFGKDDPNVGPNLSDDAIVYFSCHLLPGATLFLYYVNENNGEE